MEKRRLVSDTSPTRVETLIEDAAGRIPNHPALIFGARCWTYTQLRDEMDRRAALLVEQALQPGDVVAVVAAVSDEVVLAALACCRANVASCYLAPTSTSVEIIAMATQAGARLILTPDGAPHPALPALPSIPIALPGPMSDTLRPRSRSGDMNAVSMLQSTSGTTGSAVKLVERSHRAQNWRSAMPPWDVSPEDRTYIQRPGGSIMLNCCRSFSVGATIILATTLDPAHMEAEMARHRATAVSTIPVILRLLADRAQPPPDNLHLRAVRSASAALPPAVARAIAERYAVPLLHEYASAEGGSMIETPRGGAPTGSIGQPLAGVEVRLVDSDGGDVPEGATGELIVRSPGLMRGYRGDPAATAKVLRDGWLWTGDLARRDGDGCYYLEGRRTLRINVGGYKVAPEEVEAVLETHPGVREAVVLAMPDAARGEVVRAVIVPEGAPPPVRDLRRFCRERLATYKVPRHWEFREALPRSPLGKVLRHNL